MRIFLTVCCTLHILFAPPAQTWSAPEVPTAKSVPAARLIAAYPEAGMVLENSPDGAYIRIGEARLLFAPVAGCPAASPEQPADAPLCAMFRTPYPAGPDGRQPPPGVEPGRIRNEALLKSLYGADSRDVRKNCVPTRFLGATLPFNKKHGAAAALARVSVRLEDLIRREPALKDYILPIAGTLSQRNIAGLKRLSPHAFGTAIDLNVKKGLYWRWSTGLSPEKLQKASLAYPQAIVDAFEAEGFIWGGKWHSFDLMHFEYRPELLAF